MIILFAVGFLTALAAGFGTAHSLHGFGVFVMSIYSLYLYISGFSDYQGVKPVTCASTDADIAKHAENLIITHVVFAWIAFIVIGLAVCCSCVIIIMACAK